MKRVLFIIMITLVYCLCFCACTPGEALPDEETMLFPDKEASDSLDSTVGSDKEAIKVFLEDEWTIG